MPNRIIRSPSRVGKGAKRLVEWSISSVPTGFSAAVAGAKTIAVLVPSTILGEFSPATLVRTHLELRITSDQAGASEDQIGAVGCAFVNDVAGALGITALPGPASESSWGGWFLHKFFIQRFLFASSAGIMERGQSYSIDSKAMRKFASDESLVIMIENFGTFGFSFALSARFLIKAG